MEESKKAGFLKSLADLVTPPTVKPLANFLWQKLDGYLRNKYGSMTAEEKAVLEEQIEGMKKINDELQRKIRTDEEITQSEADALKQRVVDIEELQIRKKLPEVLISPELFENWIDNEEKDIEDKASVAKRELDILISKALEIRVRDKERWKIEDISSNLEMYVNHLREARRELRGRPDLVSAQQRKMEAEIALRNNLDLAKELLGRYRARADG